MEYNFLQKIKSPEDVKKLSYEEIDKLCNEMRHCIIDTVSKNGGHLASNLGVVELTVALHRVFSSPDDAIIFDVGHQSYPHKLLTGRFDRFNTLRTKDGISGFMKPNESPHDYITTGHSSNSISAAYGIYKAKKLLGEKGTAVAVIGDGALTGGLAYEALNNAGNTKGNFIIILNDNKMSISQNVGALARGLTKLRNQPKYRDFKFKVGKFLSKLGVFGLKTYRLISRIKDFLKSVVYRNNIFSSLGFNYLGPVNGHDVKAMESLFSSAIMNDKPTLIHVLTTKGKGYPYAENSPKNYHGVSPFDIEAGASQSGNLSYSDIAGKTLCNLADANEKICAITAAMTVGTGLSDFATEHKDRFFDVGIAEQHATAFAAGMARGGMIPFFVVYSTFLQRAYDQIIHDAAIQNLPIKILIDRAGIVGEDGETHQGIFDVAFLSSIPNVNIYSPSSFDELERAIRKTAFNSELAAIRYPRGLQNDNYQGNTDGDFTFLKTGSKKLLVTYGRLFSNAIEAQKTAEFDILKLNKIYPLSNEMLKDLLSYEKICFFEEVVLSGSVSEHLGSLLMDAGYRGAYEKYTINDEFVPSNSVSAALKEYKLDSDSMIEIMT
ncbi:MAG: 1-deoxy-D-xylulose-5-phosphate synthase [Oscillospiraceae bacterium]|nr:1-deoxy-D-xylulose-5-phosphate synthase [Oscillospiraceae bacterium]